MSPIKTFFKCFVNQTPNFCLKIWKISLLLKIANRFTDRNSRYKDWKVQILAQELTYLHGNNPINGQYFQNDLARTCFMKFERKTNP